MKQRYENLNTVHLDDLKNFLLNCGIFSEYKKGHLKCKFCKGKVNDKNIYSIFKDSGSYRLICDKPVCVQSLLEIINERKKKAID